MNIRRLIKMEKIHRGCGQRGPRGDSARRDCLLGRYLAEAGAQKAALSGARRGHPLVIVIQSDSAINDIACQCHIDDKTKREREGKSTTQVTPLPTNRNSGRTSLTASPRRTWPLKSAQSDTVVPTPTKYTSKIIRTNADRAK